MKALGSANAETRAAGVAWLAIRGGPRDAPLLHERLRDDSALVRSDAEQGLWMLWTRSGDAQVDTLMARAGEEMQAGRHAEAIATLTQVVRRKPDFAEGWNRRATVYYLAGDYQLSIADCEEVLKRNPLHFGALSGLGQIHVKLEDYEKALGWFRRALEVNPNMAGVQINIEGIQQLLEEQKQAQRKRAI